jgi:hypothetical protein
VVVALDIQEQLVVLVITVEAKAEKQQFKCLPMAQQTALTVVAEHIHSIIIIGVALVDLV